MEVEAKARFRDDIEQLCIEMPESAIEYLYKNGHVGLDIHHSCLGCQFVILTKEKTND